MVGIVTLMLGAYYKKKKVQVKKREENPKSSLHRQYSHLPSPYRGVKTKGQSQEVDNIYILSVACGFYEVGSDVEVPKGFHR